MDSNVFRRLQDIKQLSHAYVVYPSAIHTRFEHSLGALHIADRMCQQLEFNDDRRELVRLSMLLHDIGHGPFSHLFEDVLNRINQKKFNHEDISCWIIKEIPVISSLVGNKAKQIINILQKNDKDRNWIQSGNPLNSDIVSSGLDADKLDYLRRDSYHIGVAYGQFDLERIITTLRKTPNETRVCLDARGKDSIENYRLGRYLMHAQVYEHHARIAADRMFLKALHLAVDKEKILDRNALRTSNNSSHKRFLDYYLKLDDRKIYDQILDKRNSDAAKILRAVRERRLLKRACDYSLLSMVDSEVSDKIVHGDPHQIEEEIAKNTGIDMNEIVVYLSTINIKLYDRRDILILWRGSPIDLNALSPIKSDSVAKRFLVFGPSNRDKLKNIRKSVADYLGIAASDLDPSYGIRRVKKP